MISADLLYRGSLEKSTPKVCYGSRDGENGGSPNSMEPQALHEEDGQGNAHIRGIHENYCQKTPSHEISQTQARAAAATSHKAIAASVKQGLAATVHG
jgi:hypothetical protein